MGCYFSLSGDLLHSFLSFFFFFVCDWFCIGYILVLGLIYVEIGLANVLQFDVPLGFSLVTLETYHA